MLEGFSFLPTTIGYLIATRMLVDIINHLGGIVSTSLSERDHRTSFPKTRSWYVDSGQHYEFSGQHYEVIQTEIDHGRGHRCGQTLDSLFRRTLESARCLSVVCLSGRTRTRQSCPDFHRPCPPTSVLIPDLRFDFAYGRFIHLFDHNFAQDSFRNSSKKSSNS